MIPPSLFVNETLDLNFNGNPGLGLSSPLERDALIALYNATDGPNWTNNSGWLGGAGSECAWFGIVAHSGQSVFFLILILGLVLGLG